MEAEVYSWIKNIVVYMIINTIIMNLLGNKSYKKYVSIVSGMILVLIVISPLVKLMKLEDNLDYFLQSNDFAIESSDFKNELNQMEEEQSDAIFAEYKEKIKKQVEELLLAENVYLKSFQVEIDRKTDSSTFGEILNMNITASIEQNKEKEDSLQIDQIDIDKIDIGEKDEDTSKDVPSPIEINIKNKLSDFYNIEQSNINISIQGG
ncbi:MAG: stage III sporulation protein AF [Herbinix sp.]|nr:stage III sporulation protein AF [Herbinix sp.]